MSDLWESEVAPALLEVDETLAEHSFTREFRRATAKDAGWYVAAGTSVWVGLAGINDVNQLVAAAVASAPKAVQAVAEGVLATTAAKRSVKKSELVYLHAVERSLSR